jgi:hypothetical protein
VIHRNHDVAGLRQGRAEPAHQPGTAPEPMREQDDRAPSGRISGEGGVRRS